MHNTACISLIRAWLFLLLPILVVGVSSCGLSAPPETARREETRNASRGTHSSDRYDLTRDENRGGHTLSRHVARTDKELRERLLRERNISAASTWTDRETAEETVAAGLLAERDRINSWVGRGERRPNLALHFDAGRPIGRSLHRGAEQAVSCTRAVIVLRANGPDSYFVLTTYPEDRE